MPNADLAGFAEPEPLLASAFRQLSAETGADFCFCFLLQENRFRLAFAAGVPDYARENAAHLAASDQICSRAAELGRRMEVTGIQRSGDPGLAALKSIGADSLCCYPLIAAGKTLGAIAFGTRRTSGFGVPELALQPAIAGEIALALDRLQLIRELASTRAALENANSKLRRANTDLEQFAFSASHDLREPLRHLAIFSDLLTAKATEDLSGECREYLEVISRSARRIELLVRDLLAYTGAGADSPEGAQQCDGNHAVARALAALSGAIAESQASVDVTALPAACVHPLHLEQIFSQLLENALKYHRPGARPEIHVFAREQQDQPIFCVRDNGIGIAPEYRNLVFGLFKRLHSSEEYEGTGIGLAICHKIVERYGGEIWVESREGEGATFCFTLGKQTNEKRSVSAA